MVSSSRLWQANCPVHGMLTQYTAVHESYIQNLEAAGKATTTKAPGVRLLSAA